LNHDQPASTSSLWTGEYLCRLAPEHAQRHLARFQAAAHWSYVMGNPTADHLFTTVKLNVYRAFVQYGSTRHGPNLDEGRRNLALLYI
jgi:hypothetical protein